MAEIISGLVLASASPRRLELLKRIHIIPEIVKPANIDEAIKKKEKPTQYCERMARTKVILFLSNIQTKQFYQLIQLYFVVIKFLVNLKI